MAEEQYRSYLLSVTPTSVAVKLASRALFKGVNFQNIDMNRPAKG